ncbi:MAG: TRAP transporter substrate-binding protein DctP [Actinomycetes bacterium]
MKRLQRPRLLIASALAPLMVLAACGGGSGDEENSAGSASGCEDSKLRLSHQWPAATGGEDGDFRSELAQQFADKVDEATDGGVAVQIFPGSSLVESTEQYDAMMQGAVDLSVFPLDYASGRVPDFSVTLMPALVRNHEQAQAWQDAEIGQRLEEVMDENGIKVLTWVWNAGAIGAKGADPIVAPDDVKQGMTMRAAGSYVEGMLKDAGAGISSLPSNEIYTAMQTGVLDAAVTSTGSFASYNLQEQVQTFTSPTENTFWFMFEPLIISNEAFEGLCPEHQDALVSVGEELQEFAYTASEEDDTRVEKLFADAGVEVVTMDDDAFAQWQELAQKQWDKFASSAPNGEELMELAKEASGQ